MSNKEKILDLYYNQHLKQNKITEIICTTTQYVSKVVRADKRNKQEKEKRKKKNYEMMFTYYPDLVYITQLKEMLGIAITLAYRLARNKTIKSLKVGRQYKIQKRNVIAYLTNQNEIKSGC